MLVEGDEVEPFSKSSNESRSNLVGESDGFSSNDLDRVELLLQRNNRRKLVQRVAEYE